jgi:hypothetical protein
MRTEAEIRAHYAVIKAMIELPGQAPEALMLLPKSHLVLLEWVLNDDTPLAKRIDAVYKAIASTLDHCEQLRTQQDTQINGKTGLPKDHHN